MVFGIILGPSSPGDIDSFLAPLIDELILLDNGIPNAYDVHTDTNFTLRAAVTIITGDMVAIQKVMSWAGPNGKFPCRCCSIKGIRSHGNADGNGKHYYFPHTFSGYDVGSLPTRRNIRSEITRVCIANTNAARTDSGISGYSGLLKLRSLQWTRSFPHDSMHMLLLNTTRHLFKIWHGDVLPATEDGEDMP